MAEPGGAALSPLRGRALARNTVWNLAGFGVPLVAAAVAIPPTIAGLGADRFGILTLGWVVLGYFHLFDLGLTRATTKLVADALAEDAARKLRDYVWVAAGLQAALGLLGGAVLALATPFLTERALSIPSALVGEAHMTFLILAASVPAVLVTGSFQGALAGAQRFDLINAVRVPFSTANYLVPLVGLALDWSLVGIVAVLFLLRVLALGVHVWQCLAVFPDLGGRVARLRDTAGQLLGFGAWVTISSAVGPVLMYLDRFILGSVVSVGAVGYYAAASELVTRLMIIPGALAASLFPALAAASRGSDRGSASVVMAHALKYLAISLGLCSAVLFVCAADILQLWLGNGAREYAWVLRILAIGVLVNAFAHVPFTALHANGRPDFPAKFHLIELPCHVVVVVGLVNAWGVVGAALAWAVRALLDATLLFAANARVSPISLAAMRRARLPQALGVVLVCTGILGLLSQLPFSVAGRLGLVAVILVISAGAAFRFALDPEERAFLVGWFRLLPGTR